jgi:hypothetical protein
MRKSFHDGLTGLAPAGAALLMLVGVAGAAPSEGPAARVTAAVGETSSAGAVLDPRGSLAEGADVDTGDDGGCSLLVDGDALMELCAGTELHLERKGGDPNGARVVNLERGEIRMVVEPRLGEERIEVHTPAAIATILGTIAYVSVDALGVTTVTSRHARVLVESAAAGVKGATTVSEGEQAVVEPGRAPSPARRLDEDELAAVGGCLVDFHEATLGYDRRNRLAAAIDEAMREAMEDAARGDVAAGFERFTALLPPDPRPGPPEPRVGPPPVLDPVSTGAGSEALSEILGDDSTGGGIGGGDPNDGGDIPGVP